MQGCLLLSLLASGSALVLDSPELISTEDSNYALTNGKPVFYQIVMGSFPFRKQYMLWMASLRQVGKYDGTVVFVTDKPGCIAKGLGAKFLGGEKTFSDKNVDIYPGTGDGKVHIVKVPKARSVRGIKLHKSKAWKNVASAKIDHPVSSLIYTDTDVVIGKDLQSFLAYEKSIEKQQHTLALFPDSGSASWEGGSQGAVHTGVVVMFPTKISQECLKDWGNNVGGGSDDPKPIHHFGSSLMETEEQSEKEASTGVDQQALGNSRSCKSGGKGILKMPVSYLNFPNENSMQNGKTAQFVHITNTARWSQIPHDTKKRFFHRWLQISDDVDWDAKGSCDRESWATPEYMERNHIKEPSQVRALKVGKMVGA